MIPITFNKDDLNNVKKGNVRGQDLASFLSISMPKRAGILDIFDDPCGYVAPITYTTGYATITMRKGYVNIFGRCIYVEQGEQVQIALPESGSVSGTFGIRIDLGETGANEVAWFTKTTTLRQDNILNNEISGVYEFALYNYTATTTDLTLTKIGAVIQNIDDYLKGANFNTLSVDDDTKKLATAEFVQLQLEKDIPSFVATTMTGTFYSLDSGATLANNVTFYAYGSKYRDKATNKYYWMGNISARFIASNNADNPQGVGIKNMNWSGFNFVKVKDGGSLDFKAYTSPPTGTDGYYSSYISPYTDVDNTSTINYYGTMNYINIGQVRYKVNAIYSGTTYDLKITNLILEVEE